MPLLAGEGRDRPPPPASRRCQSIGNAAARATTRGRLRADPPPRHDSAGAGETGDVGERIGHSPRHRSAERLLCRRAAIKVDVHLRGDGDGGVAHDLREDIKRNASVCGPRSEGVAQVVEGQRAGKPGEIAGGLEAPAINVAMAERSAVSGGKDEVAVLVASPLIAVVPRRSCRNGETSLSQFRRRRGDVKPRAACSHSAPFRRRSGKRRRDRPGALMHLEHDPVPTVDVKVRA
jgi:hypothetical protein